ncbi:hypothetical protein BJ508DRAFT_333258 [Ascobolus immersus RN42]|uniref:Uncharacterized protein n=1 Tax=Ascobolus immersus RN42 TaxID=1160509 RepID=A0A3N4HK78_ASCIM|nr:hypothetical protein BJ508DRAFT_333258 [Ascobolus immersus RN42]
MSWINKQSSAIGNPGLVYGSPAEDEKLVACYSNVMRNIFHYLKTAPSVLAGDESNACVYPSILLAPDDPEHGYEFVRRLIGRELGSIGVVDWGITQVFQRLVDAARSRLSLDNPGVTITEIHALSAAALDYAKTPEVCASLTDDILGCFRLPALDDTHAEFVNTSVWRKKFSLALLQIAPELVFPSRPAFSFQTFLLQQGLSVSDWVPAGPGSSADWNASTWFPAFVEAMKGYWAQVRHYHYIGLKDHYRSFYFRELLLIRFDGEIPAEQEWLTKYAIPAMLDIQFRARVVDQNALGGQLVHPQASMADNSLPPAADEEQWNERVNSATPDPDAENVTFYSFGSSASSFN